MWVFASPTAISPAPRSLQLRPGLFSEELWRLKPQCTFTSKTGAEFAGYDRRQAKFEAGGHGRELGGEGGLKLSHTGIRARARSVSRRQKGHWAI